jgi:hypothetical protein
MRPGLPVYWRGKSNNVSEFVFCIVHAKRLIIQITGPPTASLLHQLLDFHRPPTMVSQPPRGEFRPNKHILIADHLAKVFQLTCKSHHCFSHGGVSK